MSSLLVPTTTLGPVTYSFRNYGALTTTFTPAASCTDSPDLSIAGIDDIQYPVLVSRCTSRLEDAISTGCVPAGNEKAQYTKDSLGDPDAITHHVPYHSPGNVCPHAWTTAGIAQKDDQGSLSATGAFNPPEEPTPAINPFPNVIAHNLSRGQTAIICCPEGYTAEYYGGCFSDAPSTAFTATTACGFMDNSQLGLTAEQDVFDYNGREITGRAFFNTQTEPLAIVATATWTIDSASASTASQNTATQSDGSIPRNDLVVWAYADMLYLVNDGEESNAGGGENNTDDGNDSDDDHGADEDDGDDNDIGGDSGSMASSRTLPAGFATILAVWGAAGLIRAAALVL